MPVPDLSMFRRPPGGDVNFALEIVTCSNQAKQLAGPHFTVLDSIETALRDGMTPTQEVIQDFLTACSYLEQIMHSLHANALLLWTRYLTHEPSVPTTPTTKEDN